jgi:hypothetical protein
MTREEGLESLRHVAGIEGLALPNDQDIPPEFIQLTLFDPVSLNILLELVGPECSASFWIRRSGTAPMPVPETSMN